MTLSDTDLINKAQNGDESAFNELSLQIRPQCFGSDIKICE